MTITARFPGRCSRCGQRFEAGTQVEWSKQAHSAAHADQSACRQAIEARANQLNEQAVATRAVAGAQKPIADFLAAARERGLKFPKARFLVLSDGPQELTLWLTGERSRVPGSVSVSVDGEWVGRIEPSGQVVGRRLSAEPIWLAALTRIGADPERAAREYGALTSHCSFCGLSLTDEGSIEAGFGPVCAKKWGLPHTAKGSKVLRAVAESTERDAARISGRSRMYDRRAS